VTLPEFETRIELAPLEQVIDLSLFLYGIYEIASTRFVQSVLKPGMTVIDVGANSGYYTLVAARLVGPRGSVHSLEPISGPFQRLKRNLSLNDFGNVTIMQSAVGSSPGRTFVYHSLVENNDGLGSLLPGPQRSRLGEEVTVTCLDNLVDDIRDRQVDLIKVDVEGTEADVFEGAAKVLSSPAAPALIFESFQVAPIVWSLTRFGYEVRHVHYSLKDGLEFPQLGGTFDNLFAAYEAPNYVALKHGGRFGSFEEIALRSNQRIPRLLRLLANVA